MADQASDGDEAEIRECLRKRDGGDSRSLDFDWENAFGVRRRGRAAVESFMAERVRPTFLQARVTVLEVRVELIAPDVAVADEYWLVEGQTDGPGGERLPDRRGRTTCVLRKLSGQWSIVVERIADLRARPKSS